MTVEPEFIHGLRATKILHYGNPSDPTHIDLHSTEDDDLAKDGDY